MATNLNINKTDVYYASINNEVYALRFKSLIVSLGTISSRELVFDKDDKYLDGSIVNEENVPIAPYRLKKSKLLLFSKEKDRKFSKIGIDCFEFVLATTPEGENGTWSRFRGGDFGLKPTLIYRTLNDCVNHTNPLFAFDGFNRQLWLREPYEVSLNEITPDTMFWVYNSNDVYGNVSYMLRTYVWDGYTAVSERVCTTRDASRLSNSNCDPLLDLLDGKFILSDDLSEHSYATREDCHKANSVKVHLFAN